MQKLSLAITAATTALISFTSPAAAQVDRASDLSAWRQDLRVIAERVPKTHPNLYYRMSKAGWDSAIKSIDARLPSMTRNQAMVALMQLTAMINDGHTGINPLSDPALGMHYYPVELHQFEDGLYIKSAAPTHANLAGAKVLRVGKLDAQEALKAATTTLSHENEWWARTWAPSRLELVELVDGLGISTSPTRLTLVIQRAGREETVTLEPAGAVKPSGHNPMAGIDRSGWISMSAKGATLAQKNPGRPYWHEYVAADSTLFVSYRMVINMDNPTNAQFWNSVFAAADSLPATRMVIDLRDNIGGNSFYNRQVIRSIVARPQLDRADRLFVITGPRTFSAAMNLVLDLEEWTNATMVGEPTGNATVFFGDHDEIKLPVSGITVNVSTLPWYPAHPKDKRPYIAPKMYTPITSADYRANVDPAMKAISARGKTSTIADRVQAAILSGDTATAVRIALDAAKDPINRFHTPEAEINALGYRLLPTNRSAALEVFRINTRAFPRSANVWDSFGEALAAAGQRDAAVASYRKALELAPGYASAVQALERLGARR